MRFRVALSSRSALGRLVRLKRIRLLYFPPKPLPTMRRGSLPYEVVGIPS